MFGGKSDWLAGHAEPVEHDAWFSGDEPGARTKETTWGFGAGLEVLWRVHVPGREPYEFRKSYFDVPGWVVKDSRQGSRRTHVRLQPGHGLLREVGVPCRVHPSDPHKIDLDWKAGYKLHEPAWDRIDAVDKRVSANIDGFMGQAFNRIKYLRREKFTPEEKAAIEAEAAEQIRTYQGADVRDWNKGNFAVARELRAEARRLESSGLTAPGMIMTRAALDDEGVRVDIAVEFADPRTDERRMAVVSVPLIGRGIEHATRPGEQVVVFLDPDDPEKFSMAPLLYGATHSFGVADLGE
jgi:hypothetical protein